MQESQTEHISKEPRPLGTVLLRFLSAHWLLIVGSIAWWGSHYLLLWNPRVTVADSFVSGFDSRFIATVAGTVVVFGLVTLLARRRHNRAIAQHPVAPVLFAVGAIAGFVLIAAPFLFEAPRWMSAVGAILSGVGNSLVLLMCGELHSRLDLRVLPLVIGLEMLGGIFLFALLFSLSFPALLASASALILATAFLYRCCARRYPPALGSAAGTVVVDTPWQSLLALALIVGCSYGVARTFSLTALDPSALSPGVLVECLGTLCGVILLVGAFFLQRRCALFELCLLLVIPLVATGMLLVSLQGGFALVPELINMGGFACFFGLMWYFAAVLSHREPQRSITFATAALLFCNQLGQLLGALVPAQYANAFSSSVVYLILFAATLFMYWRTKSLQHKGTDAAFSRSSAELRDRVTAEEQGSSAENGGIDSAETQRWADALGLSPREVEIASLLYQRLPYRHISETLFISENTVKTHVRNIYKKADVSSREELLEALDALAKKG